METPMLISPSYLTMTRRMILGFFGALAFSPAIAQSDNWPAKPMRVVVPFPAGGGTDIIAREVTQKMATNNKWTFVIDNKPGSGGNIGIDNAAKSIQPGWLQPRYRSDQQPSHQPFALQQAALRPGQGPDANWPDRQRRLSGGGRCKFTIS
jgi:hypothetical protein